MADRRNGNSQPANGKTAAGAGSAYNIDLKVFSERLKLLYSHWNKHRSDLWGSSDVVAIATPKASEDLRYLKSSALNIWLVGYEFPETIMVFMKKQIHFLCSTKKVSLLEVVKKSAKEAVGVDVVMHEKTKSDDGSALMEAIFRAIRTQSKADGHDTAVVGHIAREAPEGNLLETWSKKLEEANFQLGDVTNGLSDLFAVKDNDEILNIKRAAVLSASVMTEVVVKKLETVIDEEKKVTHSSLMDEAEKAIMEPSKAKVKLRADNVDICYPPIFQSGGQFDLRPSAASNDELLYYDSASAIICAVGSRYKSYCSNIARTFLIDATSSQSKAYEVLFKAHNAAISELKPGKKVSAAYQAALAVVEKEPCGHYFPKQKTSYPFGICFAKTNIHSLLVHPSMAFVRAAQGTSADSNTCGGYRYDVFLSFRGEDTRKTFTDHLYTALNNAGFLTFRDDDELERGEDIKPGLQKAIQLSRASVVVFSKDYASSRWCLDELVLILERKRTTSNHVVLPVFYDVDPSHVRKQTGSIGKAFARHQKNQSPKKVKGWREALAEVADLAGMVLQNQADGYESKFIEKIVKVIGDKLSRTPLSIEPKLIGIQSQVERINLWLQDGSNDVGIFIVYGMSGIGKTTIAKHVYNSNFRSFEGSSFIESIKETADRPNGLVQIQMQLLSNILNGREVKIHSVSEGIIKIEGAISSRKVLLVLDDVEHMDQLDAILKMKDRFYPGSKILITTRRERLLKAHQVTKVHRVETLDYNESLELFSWHAFGQDHPIEEYMEHSKMVVQHSGGLPLALRVLGSTLSGESIDVWESALEKLKVIPNGEILNKLRISYDSLQDDHDQTLFLHIACFLIGRDKNYIVRILNGCDFFTTIGIHNLIDRCLVTIDKYDKVNMHDMIRDMGREIVRLESEEPEKRSRLWRHKDSFEVLRDKNGTQTIQGLVLDMRMHLANSPINTNETILETNAFERMQKLKLLHLSHVQLDGCYAKFPLGLRWLCWLGFPLHSIPIDFPLENVIVLEMQYSNLGQVCKGTKVLPLLKILDFSHSHDLIEIMDFSLCPSLEELILVDCTSLKSVHESIGNLERLVYLNMKDCKNLRMLPKNMCMLKSLETLILSSCSSLDEFPVEMMKQIESLKVLKTDGIPLNELWPERSSSILSSFPCSLVELNLSRCNLSDDAFPWDLSNLSSIRRLYLDENPICSLPIFIKGLRRLDHLSFYDCERLKSLVGLPKGHECLYVSQCRSLEKVSYLQDYFFNWSPEFHSIGGSIDNLVEWQYWYKLEPIGRVDVEMIKLLGLCNLESLPNIRMHKFGRMVWCDDWSPVQGLYQYGIFSTFLPGNEFFPRNEVPSRLIHKSGGSSSISFTVPLLPNHRGRGLNVFAVYENVIDFSDTELVYDCMDIRMTIKVSNKSKGLKWIYVPLVYGIPGEGEDMTWLSHWKMENETIALECGDKVSVSVLMRHPWFQLKEFGVELVQEHQNNTMINTQHNTKSDPNYPFVISGDLSIWEHIPGIYFLGGFSKEYIKSMPRSNWINHLIMDSDEEDTDKEEGQEDEPDYTIAKTRAASNNYGLGGWKVLLIVVGFFFTLALVLWSSIS